MKDIKGCGTAMVTPFAGEGVDYDALRRLVELQKEAGIDFLVPLGTSAETPCLEDEEKREVLSFIRALVPGLPLIAGVGTNSLKATQRNIRLLEDCGADAWLVVVPFYNKPTQEGMYQYFKAISESTDKPIVMYNVPSRTGSNMSAETTLRLSLLPNVLGIKEASGDLNQIYHILDGRPEGFKLFSGNDDQTYPIMAAGGDGVISVVSNIAPKPMLALTGALRSGDMETAKALDKKLSGLYKACFVESNPIPVKGGLAALGLCSDEMRLPLTPATSATVKLMMEAYERAR